MQALETSVDSKRVLIVDNDGESRRKIGQSLLGRPVVCDEAQSASEALQTAYERRPDQIVLDMYLPDLSGLAFCRMVREDAALGSTPLVVVSAQSGEMDRILAFEAGADDFLAKPFYAPELAARVAAVLRGFEERVPDRGEGTGFLTVDAAAGRALVNGERLDLTAKEFELLSLLVQRAGRVVRRPELIARLWGDDPPTSDRAIDAHVKSIRRKLGSARDCIETVRGVGYRYAAGNVG